MTAVKTYSIDDRVEVEVWNYKTEQSDWLLGTVKGFAPGELNEIEDRINVVLDDGRKFFECHRDCVRHLTT